MKCTACGADLTEGAKFCEYCGTPVAAAPAPAPAPAEKPAPPQQDLAFRSEPAQQPQTQYTQPQVQEPQFKQPQYGQPQTQYAQPEPAKSNKLNVWSLILGISSLGGTFTFCWWPFVGLIAIGISIAGLIISSKAKKTNPNKMARTGFILSLIGLILSVILTIVMTAVWMAALNSNRYYYY